MTLKYKIILVLLMIGVGIQFIPTSINKDRKENTPTVFVKLYSPSLQVQNLLKNSCNDCHSNYTEYPWYNRLQPIRYFLENHIKKGKSELNFDEFDTYSDRKKRNKLNAIIGQVERDQMPLVSYSFIHKESKLSATERKLLVSYFDSLSALY
ncbi:heme-binding domain-containing protein [Bernardetia sp.]|uniref:heme-binding domain-containing protein n=1 Tax=Bernardetia sp. TaxID=1937974 RepID=UPI0025BAE7BE|nr:heme-binding domain-containing protein [Bernardetia sp.]